MGEPAEDKQYGRNAIIVQTRDSKCPWRVNSKCPLCVDGVHLRVAECVCCVSVLSVLASPARPCLWSRVACVRLVSHTARDIIRAHAYTDKCT